MTIRSIETIRTEIQPNLVIVALEDESGVVGIGETFFGAGSVEAHIHEVVAPILAETRAAAPQAIAAALSSYVGYTGSGTETRANSAVDIAAWDLLAKRAGLPLNELLGGPRRDSIPVYNTCAGYSYINAQSRQSSSNWGTGITGERPNGDYEDLWAFHREPAKLARELMDAGFPGMKIWPFDRAAEESGGSRAADLRDGLHVLDQIRDEVGTGIKVYLELHSLWTLAGAERLLRAVEPFELEWAEDPVRSDRPEALAALREQTSTPLAGGESVGAGYLGYRSLFEQKALDVAILDLGWCGGITAGTDLAALADHHGLAVALHDCTGPVSLAVAAHLATTAPNIQVQEVARAFYHGWYPQIADGLPHLEHGRLSLTEAPGHGIELRNQWLQHPGTSRRKTLLK